MKGWEKGICFFCMALVITTGCVSADDRRPSSLSRQQSATIESLNNEILRLNEELDAVAGLREVLREEKPKIEQALSEQIARGDAEVSLDSRGLTVSVLDHALFDPDETQFTPAGESILAKIAVLLSGALANNRVLLEGHTDAEPVEGSDGVTNWEYSIGRAAAVLHYFMDVQSLAPARFGVAGYAEYRPKDSNATEAGRDRNRRVEIVVLPQKVLDGASR